MLCIKHFYITYAHPIPTLNFVVTHPPPPPPHSPPPCRSPHSDLFDRMHSILYEDALLGFNGEHHISFATFTKVIGMIDHAMKAICLLHSNTHPIYHTFSLPSINACCYTFSKSLTHSPTHPPPLLLFCDMLQVVMQLLTVRSFPSLRTLRIKSQGPDLGQSFQRTLILP